MKATYRCSLPPEIRASLDYCWKEGVAAQVVFIAFSYYTIPFGLFLGATTQAIGWLVAAPNFLSSLSQLFAVRAVRMAGSRHRTLVIGVWLQSVFILPLAFLPFVEWRGGVFLLVVLVAVFHVLGSILGPAWGSLVSDYLPEGQRGQYFGWRWRMVSIAGMAGLGVWGLLLYVFQDFSPRAGFAILFLGAAIFRFISSYYMSRMADVPVASSAEDDLPFWKLVRKLRERNFFKFLFYASAVTCAIQIAAPYLSVQMLTHLKFSYLGYTCVHLASVIGGLIAFPIWGHHADRVGTARILKITGFLTVLTPLFWIFARDPVSLSIVEGVAGFISSGFTLSSANFIYDAVSPSSRVRYLAYFNLINGAAIFLGAWFGGWAAEHVPPLFGEPLYTVFLLSAGARLLAAVSSVHFKEVRTGIEAASNLQLFLSVMGVRPLIGEATEVEIFPPVRPSRENRHIDREPSVQGRKR